MTDATAGAPDPTSPPVVVIEEDDPGLLDEDLGIETGALALQAAALETLFGDGKSAAAASRRDWWDHGRTRVLEISHTARENLAARNPNTAKMDTAALASQTRLAESGTAAMDYYKRMKVDSKNVGMDAFVKAINMYNTLVCSGEPWQWQPNRTPGVHRPMSPAQRTNFEKLHALCPVLAYMYSNSIEFGMFPRPISFPGERAFRDPATTLYVGIGSFASASDGHGLVNGIPTGLFSRSA